MKQKNKVKRLKRKQKAWDDMEPSQQKGTIRPGSLKRC